MTTFVDQSFTGTNGTALTSLSPSVGTGPWVRDNTASGNTLAPVISSNTLIGGDTPPAGNAFYLLSSTTPPSADYSVTGYLQAAAGTNVAEGPGLRMNGTGGGYYAVLYTAVNHVSIFKSSGGGLTELASITVSPSGSAIFPIGDTYLVKLTAAGTSLTVVITRASDGFYLNPAAGGSWQSGAVNCVTVTDSSFASAGFVGMWKDQEAAQFAWTRITADAVSGSQTATPGAGTVTLTGYAPTMVRSGIATPGAGTVTLTGYAPSVVRSNNGVFTSKTVANNTGASGIQASRSNWTVTVLDLTGAFVVKKTAQSSNGSGIITFSDSSVVTGTDYYAVIFDPVTGERGVQRFTAT